MDMFCVVSELDAKMVSILEFKQGVFTCHIRNVFQNPSELPI